MEIIKDDGMYKASRITGPTHNYLGISVVRSKPATVRIVERQLKNNFPREIDESKLLHAVTEGVARANREASSDVHVEYVEYVASDTPDYNAYVELATAIILLASNELA